ncbi:hypothetical protein Moror_1845 [Moniliophthora roreri MCA 2997]|uniref:Uncharacterized protein n=2 Tax=Moniliophthora roreri TaxID=221103 RepID=V2Y7S4_MONRO|nr:hypothetical protein Moror_1845 [Moniliophthora roreri MCA 2997]KAI3614503.1 hypothetical protein WG66_009743 [Moniliophthora roreri]
MSKRKFEHHDSDSEEAPRKRGAPYSTSGLLNLLDLSSIGATASSEIDDRFDAIADALLNRFQLCIRKVNGSEVIYRVMELEFYWWKTGCHEDPFTHGSAEQRFSGRWYFHRAPKKSTDSSRSLTSSTGYRGGTRKGLDLTFGGPVTTTVSSPYFSQSEETTQTMSDASENHGGILLRSLRRIPDDTVISGPSLLVDEILRQFGSLRIADVVDGCWNGNISAFRNEEKGDRMFWRQVPTSELGGEIQIYRSPRIGLDLSHPGTSPEASHPRVEFLGRRYRYFVEPNLLTANGRPQTFLGVLKHAAPLSGGGSRCLSRKRMTELTGITDQSVANYLGYYLEGYDKGSLKGFVGPAGKGAGSSPATYLRMMGAVAKARNEDV